MNTVHTSNYLYVLQFLSSVSYNFPSTGLLHPCLNLFLGCWRVFFDPLVNGIVFLSFPLWCSLLVYKHTTDFWIIILYPAALLNSFISSSSFLMESLGFSLYNIMWSAEHSYYCMYRSEDKKVDRCTLTYTLSPCPLGNGQCHMDPLGSWDTAAFSSCSLSLVSLWKQNAGFHKLTRH